MKVQVIEKRDSDMKMIVEGIKPPFANELRRIMMNETPSMAIEYVDFVKNDSALNDEIIANRLGQVPLKFDKKAYDMDKEVKFSLSKKGSGMVYAGDIKFKSRDVEPVFPKTPIVELFEGQEIEFEGAAKLGTGKQHSKWQSAVVGFTNLVEPTKKETEMKLCSNHLHNVSGVKGIKSKTSECELCKSLNSDNGHFRVIDDSFIFTVESASGLTADEIVSDVGTLMEDKLKEFDKAVKKIKE